MFPFFPPAACKILLKVFYFQQFEYDIPTNFLSNYTTWVHQISWMCGLLFLIEFVKKKKKHAGHSIFRCDLRPILFPLSFYMHLTCTVLSAGQWELAPFQDVFFSLHASLWMISIELYSISLIIFSAVSNLLLFSLNKFRVLYFQS